MKFSNALTKMVELNKISFKFAGAAVLAALVLTAARDANAQVKPRSCDLGALAQDRTTSGYIKFDYCLVLGREADPSGLDTFTKRAQYGLMYFRNDMRLFSAREIIDRLMTSPEGQARFGITNTGDHAKIVRTAYNAILSREPSAVEQAPYVAMMDRLKASGLNEHNRYQALMYKFMSSAEFKNKYPNYR